MFSLKIVSLNLLNDHRYWDDRKPLITAEIKRLNPDIIAFQEFLISKKTSQWLEESYPEYQAYLCPKTGEKMTESLALLSKLPVIEHVTMDYGTQKRVAQRISIKVDEKVLNVANTHMYFGPLRDKPRLKQVHRLLEWLPQTSIVCGDFNAEPGYRSMLEMKKRFNSAYATIHSQEPEWTCPTSLKRGIALQHGVRHVGLRAAGIYKHRQNIHWHGTIDYIYADQNIKIKSCDLAFDKASPDDKYIYPSDHLGLVAEIGVI
jgi:endonuclease/exonuclease/phosphatase family metal-dependent hydrolase